MGNRSKLTLPSLLTLSWRSPGFNRSPVRYTLTNLFFSDAYFRCRTFDTLNAILGCLHHLEFQTLSWNFKHSPSALPRFFKKKNSIWQGKERKLSSPSHMHGSDKHTHMHARMHVGAYTHACACAHTHACACTHKYTHACTRACARTHTHTHTHTRGAGVKTP